MEQLVILDHFRNKFEMLAASVGVVPFHKNVVCCNGWTTARMYIKGKLVKFGISLNLRVAWLSGYMFSDMDNGAGTKPDMHRAGLHITTFMIPRPTLHQKCSEKLVLWSAPSALWALQMIHSTQATLSAQRCSFQQLLQEKNDC